jgi:hypothetical protein
MKEVKMEIIRKIETIPEIKRLKELMSVFRFVAAIGPIDIRHV